VRLIVDRRQMLEIEVRIHLRRGDAGVAEHLLDRAQVARGLQHVRGERMAQHVRMHPCRQALRQAAPLQPQLDHAHAQTLAALADKQRRFVGAARRCALPGPDRDRFPGLAADRHEAQLAALAEDAHLAGQQVFETRQVERREFGQAQAGGVEQFEHRLVANFQQVFGGRCQQAIGFVRRQRFRQRLAGFSAAARCPPGCAWPPALAEPAIEAAPGGKRAPERAAAQATRVQLGDETADVVRLDGGEAAFAAAVRRSGGRADSRSRR
jgi:hypothetical protein